MFAHPFFYQISLLRFDSFSDKSRFYAWFGGICSDLGSIFGPMKPHHFSVGHFGQKHHLTGRRLSHWPIGPPRNSLCTGRWSSLHSLDHEGRIFLDLERWGGCWFRWPVSQKGAQMGLANLEMIVTQKGWHQQVILLSKWPIAKLLSLMIEATSLGWFKGGATSNQLYRSHLLIYHDLIMTGKHIPAEISLESTRWQQTWIPWIDIPRIFHDFCSLNPRGAHAVSSHLGLGLCRAPQGIDGWGGGLASGPHKNG